jgi:hypothetical protein
MHKAIFIFLALPTLLCSCVVPQAPMQPVQTVFDEAEFAPYAASGTATVTGQAFLKTLGGDVKLGAGNTVQLLPVTTYTSELRRRGTLRGERVGPVDPRIEKYRRTTIADGNGNFEFRNLPAGEYYVTCVITWEIPSQYGLQQTGGIAYGTVQVGAGETAKVVVTR